MIWWWYKRRPKSRSHRGRHRLESWVNRLLISQDPRKVVHRNWFWHCIGSMLVRMHSGIYRYRCAFRAKLCCYCGDCGSLLYVKHLSSLWVLILVSVPMPYSRCYHWLVRWRLSLISDLILLYRIRIQRVCRMTARRDKLEIQLLDWVTHF